MQFVLFFSSFDADDVRILVGSPSFQDVNSIMRFYIDLPPSTVSNPSIAMVPGNQLAGNDSRNSSCLMFVDLDIQDNIQGHSRI